MMRDSMEDSHSTWKLEISPSETPANHTMDTINYRSTVYFPDVGVSELLFMVSKPNE